MNWPQYVYLALNFIGLGIALSEHGKPKTGYHNFWTTVFAFMLCLYLLYEGGFFNAS